MSIPRLTLVLHGVAKCALPIAYGWEKRRESRAVGGSENLERWGGGPGGSQVVIPRFSIRDHWIQESIKQIFKSGLFWAVGAAKKKIQTAISMLLLRSVFLCFHGQKKIQNFFKNIVVSALKSYIA